MNFKAAFSTIGFTTIFIGLTNIFFIIISDPYPVQPIISAGIDHLDCHSSFLECSIQSDVEQSVNADDSASHYVDTLLSPPAADQKLPYVLHSTPVCDSSSQLVFIDEPHSPQELLRAAKHLHQATNEDASVNLCAGDKATNGE